MWGPSTALLTSSCCGTGIALGSNYEVLDELTQLLFIFDRLLLYWTGEPKKEHALMSFSYRPDIVEQAGIHFTITKPPELKVCKECDLRAYRTNERVLPKPVISNDTHV